MVERVALMLSLDTAEIHYTQPRLQKLKSQQKTCLARREDGISNAHLFSLKQTNAIRSQQPA